MATKQKMRLIDNDGSYRYKTTLHKIYEVELVEGIFDTRPFYEFIDDNGSRTGCHTYRFEKLSNVRLRLVDEFLNNKTGE